MIRAHPQAVRLSLLSFIPLHYIKGYSLASFAQPPNIISLNILLPLITDISRQCNKDQLNRVWHSIISLNLLHER